VTPLVLVPGLMCDARLWGPQIAAFSGARPIHLAAIGGADRVDALAAAVLRAAPLRFALAGLSMGGIVAMEALRQAPIRVERLALLDTNPLAEAPDVAARRERQIERARAGGLAEVIRDEMKPHYLAEGPRRAEILDLVMAMAESLGPAVFERQSRALQTRPDQSETLAAFAGPALVLCGAEDRLCPVARHEMMHGLLRGSKLAVVAGAGHLPTLEQPAAVNAALAAWLEQAPDRAP
jgi:pimeloyl-ACP methyl ester carboxylesterase